MPTAPDCKRLMATACLAALAANRRPPLGGLALPDILRAQALARRETVPQQRETVPQQKPNPAKGSSWCCCRAADAPGHVRFEAGRSGRNPREFRRSPATCRACSSANTCRAWRAMADKFASSVRWSVSATIITRTGARRVGSRIRRWIHRRWCPVSARRLAVLGVGAESQAGYTSGGMPACVDLTPKDADARFILRTPPTQAGYLGVTHTGFEAQAVDRANIMLNGVDPRRLSDRRTLLASFDNFRRELDAAGPRTGSTGISSRPSTCSHRRAGRPSTSAANRSAARPLRPGSRLCRRARGQNAPGPVLAGAAIDRSRRPLRDAGVQSLAVRPRAPRRSQLDWHRDPLSRGAANAAAARSGLSP